jgi:hypothetical protein
MAKKRQTKAQARHLAAWWYWALVDEIGDHAAQISTRDALVVRGMGWGDATALAFAASQAARVA